MPSPENQRKPKPDAAPASGLEVGDRVAYSRAFLKSISALTGDLPHAKGEVKTLVPVGREVVLAEVDWDKAEMPSRVNVKNLCRVGGRAFRE